MRSQRTLKESDRHRSGRARTRDVDLLGQRDVALSHSRQHGRVVNQPADVVVDHNLLQVLKVQDVWEDEWTCGGHIWALSAHSSVEPGFSPDFTDKVIRKNTHHCGRHGWGVSWCQTGSRCFFQIVPWGWDISMITSEGWNHPEQNRSTNPEHEWFFKASGTLIPSCLCGLNLHLEQFDTEREYATERVRYVDTLPQQLCKPHP